MGNGAHSLVIRKAREEWRGAAIVATIFGLPMGGAAVAAAVAGEWGVAVLVGAVVGVPFVAIVGHLRASRIVLTGDEVAVHGFVTHRRVPRAQAARVVRAHVVQPRAPIVDTVFVLDGAGRLLIRISGHHYRRADIDHLVAALGLPVTGPPGPVTAHALSRAWPGIVPWHEAHPIRFGLYASLATIVAVVVLAMVVAALAGPT